MDLKAEYLMLRRVTGRPAARVWRVVRLCAERGQLDRALWYLLRA